MEILSDKQKEAVQYTDGPLLVIAGAGAGKTRVITERIAYLIKEKNVSPERILAVTFTNKAANEMKERVRKILQKRSSYLDSAPFIGTFHGLCAFILRNDFEAAGLRKTFVIFDRDDSKRLIRDAMKEIDPELPKRIEPGAALGIISREKDTGMDAKTFLEGRKDEFGKTVGVVWEKYERKLWEENAVDFDDLLIKAFKLLRNNVDVRKKYLSRFEYIEVDEYHDTNAIQYELVKLLAGEKKNIMVVGDVDQSIYSWRGADIKNLINFERDFSGAKTVLLEENYRSSKNILDTANAVIQKNKNRFDKTLFTKALGGEKISVYEAYDETDEANFVTEKVAEAISSGTKAEEIAVLYRANFQSRALEEAFLSKQIPHIVLGTRFFERKEVKDILAYIRAAQNPESLSDIKRVINLPPRGIGKVSIAKIFSGNEDDLSGSQKETWRKFKTMLKNIAEEIEKIPPSKVVRLVYEKSGLKDMLKNQGDEGVERMENIEELSAFAARYDGLSFPNGISKLLEDAALATDQDSLDGDPRGARLSTVHASKGLEFDIVFVTGLEQDLFPHKAIDGKSRNRDDEEERRLFYVALTRARKKLYLSHASTRMIFGSRQWNAPSEFLFDVPEELVEQEEKVEGGGKVIYFDI